MVGRQLTIKLKSNSIAELIQIYDNQIMPILRGQTGFLAATTLIAADRAEAITNTLWDTIENREAYGRSGLLSVFAHLSKVIDGPPKVADFDFVKSTHPWVSASGIA